MIDIHHHRKGGSTRADKIGVGAGGDIGGTDTSCIFMARQYTGPTRQSYRDDHRHVGVMPATASINTPTRCAEQVRTRLPCDVRCFVASLEKIALVLLFVFVIGVYSYWIKCVASTTQ